MKEQTFHFDNIIKSNNYTTIDITSSVSGTYTLKEYYKRNDIKDYCIFCLPLLLSIGDIKNHLFDREVVYNDFYENVEELKNTIDDLLNSINKDTTIRIYSSKLNIDDYLLMLYICNLLKDKDNTIKVVFVSDYKDVFSLGALDTTEIKEIFNKENILTKEEVNNYSKEWEELINVNSELRVFENNKVINKNYSDYDDIILNELDKLGQCKIPVLVGNLLANAITTSYEVQTYSYLVERLIKNNKIKINDDIIEKEK
ncbi:MAG: DUF1835 domain-containing protein [Firmicutes bacterium]|nr:DUF1835 domain-containing protein [Bacillota bacterium]